MHPALEGLVRRLKSVGPIPPDTRAMKLPDGSSSLLLRVRAHESGDLSLAGPRTRALFKTLPQAELSVLVDFEPGAARAFFGAPLRAFADRYVRLEDAWGDEGRHVVERLLSTSSPEHAQRELQRALVERLRSHPPSASWRLAREAISRIRSADARVRVASVADALGVSARHLRRVFDDAVGVSPKEFARMARLQRAMTQPGRPRTWTQRALEAGYYDQAHFIAEFRELVGTTPAAFERSMATSW